MIFSFMILLTLKASPGQITLIIEPLRYSAPSAAKINRCIGSSPIGRLTDLPHKINKVRKQLISYKPALSSYFGEPFKIMKKTEELLKKPDFSGPAFWLVSSEFDPLFIWL